MDTLKFVLETSFVGAWALPEIALVLQFFFPEAKDWWQHLTAFGGDQAPSTSCPSESFWRTCACGRLISPINTFKSFGTHRRSYTFRLARPLCGIHFAAAQSGWMVPGPEGLEGSWQYGALV